MQREVKNPAYPLDLNLIVDHADGRREYLQAVSSDLLQFDRAQRLPRIGQDIGFMGKGWTVEDVRQQQPPDGGESLEWAVLAERMV